MNSSLNKTMGYRWMLALTVAGIFVLIASGGGNVKEGFTFFASAEEETHWTLADGNVAEEGEVDWTLASREDVHEEEVDWTLARIDNQDTNEPEPDWTLARNDDREQDQTDWTLA